MKFIEATLVMPLTILLTLALITIMMNMYEDLIAQTGEHIAEVAEIYSKGETLSTVIYGALKGLLTEILS